MVARALTVFALLRGLWLALRGWPVNERDGRWHHFVAVCDPRAADGLRAKLYVDGKLAGATTSLDARFAQGGSGPVSFWFRQPPAFGEVSQVRVFDHALGPDAIQALA